MRGGELAPLPWGAASACPGGAMAGPAGRRRQDRGNAVVPVDAGDLLDEVLGGREVGPPRRREHREDVAVAVAVAVAGEGAADRLEDGDHLGLGVVDAHDPGREPDVHRHRPRRGGHPHVGDVRVGDPPAVLDEQVDLRTLRQAA